MIQGTLFIRLSLSLSRSPPFFQIMGVHLPLLGHHAYFLSLSENFEEDDEDDSEEKKKKERRKERKKRRESVTHRHGLSGGPHSISPLLW